MRSTPLLPPLYDPAFMLPLRLPLLSAKLPVHIANTLTPVLCACSGPNLEHAQHLSRLCTENFRDNHSTSQAARHAATQSLSLPSHATRMQMQLAYNSYATRLQLAIDFKVTTAHHRLLDRLLDTQQHMAQASHRTQLACNMQLACDSYATRMQLGCNSQASCQIGRWSGSCSSARCCRRTTQSAAHRVRR